MKNSKVVQPSLRSSRVGLRPQLADLERVFQDLQEQVHTRLSLQPTPHSPSTRIPTCDSPTSNHSASSTNVQTCTSSINLHKTVEHASRTPDQPAFRPQPLSCLAPPPTAATDSKTVGLQVMAAPQDNDPTDNQSCSAPASQKGAALKRLKLKSVQRLASSRERLQLGRPGPLPASSHCPSLQENNNAGDNQDQPAASPILGSTTLPPLSVQDTNTFKPLLGKSNTAQYVYTVRTDHNHYDASIFSKPQLLAAPLQFLKEKQQREQQQQQQQHRAGRTSAAKGKRLSSSTPVQSTTKPNQPLTIGAYHQPPSQFIGISAVIKWVDSNPPCFEDLNIGQPGAGRPEFIPAAESDLTTQEIELSIEEEVSMTSLQQVYTSSYKPQQQGNEEEQEVSSAIMGPDPNSISMSDWAPLGAAAFGSYHRYNRGQGEAVEDVDGYAYVRRYSKDSANKKERSKLMSKVLKFFCMAAACEACR